MEVWTKGKSKQKRGQGKSREVLTKGEIATDREVVTKRWSNLRERERERGLALGKTERSKKRGLSKHQRTPTNSRINKFELIEVGLIHIKSLNF